MMYISIKEEQNSQNLSTSKKGDDVSTQYLLRVVYDSNDENVQKLLENIFGPDQMLDVKNGKIAKINSTLTPRERESFFEMVSKTLNKMEQKEEEQSNNNESEEYIQEENEKGKNVKEGFFDEEENENKDYDEETNNKTSRKIKAEKLIKEFANFLNSI
ncbi:MAG: hypothetical protein IKM97_05950 [Clostridia bacterium]|nr:hypothetical protein [Clostridia bacterium]